MRALWGKSQTIDCNLSGHIWRLYIDASVPDGSAMPPWADIIQCDLLVRNSVPPPIIINDPMTMSDSQLYLLGGYINKHEGTGNPEPPFHFCRSVNTTNNNSIRSSTFNAVSTNGTPTASPISITPAQPASDDISSQSGESEEKTPEDTPVTKRGTAAKSLTHESIMREHATAEAVGPPIAQPKSIAASKAIPKRGRKQKESNESNEKELEELVENRCVVFFVAEYLHYLLFSQVSDGWARYRS